MRNSVAIGSGLFLLVIVVVSTQGQNRAAVNKAKIDWSTTIAKPAPEPADAQGLALRRERNLVFDSHSVAARPLDQAAADDMTTGYGMSVYHVKEDALPASASAAVVIGEVVGFQPFLSSDKSTIYTELRVKSEMIIKDTSQVLEVGSEFTVPRLGGTVLLPNSKIVTRVVPKEERVLEVGGRYVLFLNYDSTRRWFSLIKAWGLDDGKAKALAPTDVKEVIQGASKYEGMPEGEFVSAVRDSVNLSSH